jgi:hypothetical protein
MSILLDKQHQFSRMLPKLLQWCFDNGYEVTVGEVLRGKKQAEANAAAGIGIANSNHLRSLAIDLSLFKDGIYLDKSESYLPAGKYWESLGGCWGGRFHNPDGDHFSLEYKGVR